MYNHILESFEETKVTISEKIGEGTKGNEGELLKLLAKMEIKYNPEDLPYSKFKDILQKLTLYLRENGYPNVRVDIMTDKHTHETLQPF